MPVSILAERGDDDDDDGNEGDHDGDGGGTDDDGDKSPRSKRLASPLASMTVLPPLSVPATLPRNTAVITTMWNIKTSSIILISLI